MQKNSPVFKLLQTKLAKLDAKLAETSYWKATEVIRLELKRLTILQALASVRAKSKSR